VAGGSLQLRREHRLRAAGAGDRSVPEPSVPVTEVVLVALGALVLANVVAAIPGRIAARTSTALVLRAQ
jgi:hypothetical protein